MLYICQKTHFLPMLYKNTFFIWRAICWIGLHTIRNRLQKEFIIYQIMTLLLNSLYFGKGTWVTAANHHPLAEKVQHWAWGWTGCPWLCHLVHFSAPVSAHLQELDGLELSEWMESDSIKAWAAPFKLHSPSCQQENPTGGEKDKEREREGGRLDVKKFSGSRRSSAHDCSEMTDTFPPRDEELFA